jgi:sec-independent protein translocase protein TatB
VFGVSFGELVLIATVALLVVGPQKLPGMLRTVGMWLAKARRVMTEVRSQSGIDDILRAEGLEGGLNELRSIVRGAGALPFAARTLQATSAPRAVSRPETFLEDRTREYPVEGPDAQGALPEDLLGDSEPEAEPPLIAAAAANAPVPGPATPGAIVSEEPAR